MATKKEVLDVVEKTAKDMDVTIDHLGEAWVVFTKDDKKKVIFALTLMGSGVALAAGTTSWIIANKVLKTKYERLAQEEIREAKEFYTALQKRNEFKSPGEALEALHPESSDATVRDEAVDAMHLYQHGEETKDGEEDKAPVTRNIFANDQNFDYDREFADRSPEKPYIITKEEFMQNEDGFEQKTLTYYEGDDVLADENDEGIPLVDDIVGEDNLARFGAASGDPNTVYIRNEKLSLDFEVVKSDGKFAHEVLGFQHSGAAFERTPRRQKMRGGDE